MNDKLNGRRVFLKAFAVAAGSHAQGVTALDKPPTAIGSAMNVPCRVFEIRQYTIRGGRRADFARLFARAFVAPQEASGIRVFGWFDDLDDADRFVWMRGFATMEARAPALASFYGGDVWKRHRDEANAMIVDSDNVLLLRPLQEGRGLETADGKAAEIMSAYIHYLPSGDVLAFDRYFTERMLPRIESAGGAVSGRLCSQEGPNNFPRLPVRAGDSVFVWIAKFQSEAQRSSFTARRSGDSGWRDDTPDALLADLMRRPEALRLRALA